MRGLTLLRAGYLGELGGGVKPDREATAMLFDGLRRQIDASVAPGATIQWDFSDAEPWHLRVAVGRWAHRGVARPRRRSRPHLPLPPQRLGRHRRRAHRTMARSAAWEGAPDRQAADADPSAQAVSLAGQIVTMTGAEPAAV